MKREAIVARKAKANESAGGGDKQSAAAKSGSATLPKAGSSCDCGETFDIQVWHCPICAHHWQMYVQECRNCHKATKRGASRPNEKSRVRAAKSAGVSEQRVRKAQRLRKANPTAA